MKEHIVYDYDRITREEVVMGEVNSLPTTYVSEPFVSPDLIITICNTGKAHTIYDMQPVVFQQRDIAVVLPNHIIGYGNCTADYNVTVIAIAKDFFDELVHRDSFRDYLKYKTNPNFQLSEEQYHKIVTILNTLRIIVNSKHHKRHETLANLLDILFYTLTRYRGEENNPELHKSRNSFIIHAFYDLLINNYKTQHKIDWYGEQLCLTPKYLSSIIKKTTNKSAAAWIDEILILHAKRILYTRRDLTVQQVAYELGFKENATFCRFFKDQTGLRPSEYRNKK